MGETLCIFIYLKFFLYSSRNKNQNIFNKILLQRFSFKCASWSLQRTSLCLLSNWNVCCVHKKMHCGRITTFPPDSFFHLNVNLYLLLAYIILATFRLVYFVDVCGHQLLISTTLFSLPTPLLKCFPFTIMLRLICL